MAIEPEEAVVSPEEAEADNAEIFQMAAPEQSLEAEQGAEPRHTLDTRQPDTRMAPQSRPA